MRKWYWSVIFYSFWIVEAAGLASYFLGHIFLSRIFDSLAGTMAVVLIGWPDGWVHRDGSGN